METKLVIMKPKEFESSIRRIFKEEFQESAKRIKETKGKRVFSAQEAANFLKVTITTIHLWKKAGKIKYKKIGNRLYFDEDQLLKAMKPIK